jgi:hypothetical protein
VVPTLQLPVMTMLKHVSKIASRTAQVELPKELLDWVRELEEKHQNLPSAVPLNQEELNKQKKCGGECFSSSSMLCWSCSWHYSRQRQNSSKYRSSTTYYKSYHTRVCIIKVSHWISFLRWQCSTSSSPQSRGWQWQAG